jgi:hypothetical protein
MRLTPWSLVHDFNLHGFTPGAGQAFPAAARIFVFSRDLRRAPAPACDDSDVHLIELELLRLTVNNPRAAGYCIEELTSSI